MATRTLQQTPSISYDESVTDTLRIAADFTIIDRDLSTPPGSPAEGDKYLVAASGTGDWSGQDGDIAIYIDSAWVFFTPSEGDLVWVEDEDVLLVNDGSAFQKLVLGPGSSTDGNLPSFDGTAGNLLQDSGVAASDVYRSGGTDVAIADGGTNASTASGARTNLGLAIGSDVQAHGNVLDDLNTLGAASADGEFLVATGAGAFAYESGATARTSLGLGSLATQSTINNGDWSGTDLAITNGGTGASDAATAFGNLKQAATTSATGVVEKATAAEVRASTADKFIDAGLLADAAAAAGSLSDAATIAVDWSDLVHDTVTITDDRTLGNPTNEKPGQWRTIEVKGNNATERTLSFGSEYEVAPTLEDITSTKSYLVSIVCMAAGRFRAYADEGGDPT